MSPKHIRRPSTGEPEPLAIYEARRLLRDFGRRVWIESDTEDLYDALEALIDFYDEAAT